MADAYLPVFICKEYKKTENRFNNAKPGSLLIALSP
jgi:hypothetical protein